MSGDEDKLIKVLSEENLPFKTKKYIDALAHVRQNYEKFYANGLFLRLKCKPLCEILDSNDLNVESEEMVFDSVRRWLDSNSSDREASLKPLLRVVRLPLLPLKYLNDVVEPLLLEYSIKDFTDAFQNVVKNYKAIEKPHGMSLRKYQTLSLENHLKTFWEIEIELPMLLSIGGDNLETTNSVEIYSDHREEWIEPNNLAISRINYSVAYIDDKLFLVGGSKHSTPLNVIESLDLETGILLPESTLKFAREHAAAIVIGDGKLSFLYVLGGRGIDSDLDSVELWNPIQRTWTLAKSMPSKRVGLAAVDLNEKIYVLGGKINDAYTNTMEVYDLIGRTWKTKASMKEARAHFCAAAYRGCLYAVAGSKSDQVQLNTVEKYKPSDDSWVTIANITASGHVGVSRFGLSLVCAGGKQSKSVVEYDAEDNKWHALKNLHKQRAGYLIELPKEMNKLKFEWVDQRKILMIGHRDSHKACSLEVYDTRTNQWTKLNDLNINKINYSMVYNGENILMIGGDSTYNYQLNAVESLDLRTGKVSQMEPLNNPRQNSAAVIVRQGKLEYIFVFGGMKDEEFLSSVERWDSVLRTWTNLTHSQMSVARAGHGAALLRKQIYIVGGKTKKETYSATVEAYDFRNDRWTPKAPMNNPNAYFGIATFKNRIYVAGGNSDSATPVSTVERYNPFKDTWTTIANISSTGMVGISSTGKRLICAGGTSSNLVEEYVESKKSWRKLNPLGTQCSGFLIELKQDTENYTDDWVFQRRSSNRLIFLSGWEFEDAKVIEEFDDVAKKWTKLKDLPFTTTRFSSIIISNKLLLIGGQDKPYSSVNSVHAIDLSSGTIQPFPPLKHARCLPSSVLVKDGEKTMLYVLGGLDRVHLLSVEKWDPSTNEWTEGIPMTHGRYGFGCVFLHGKIYVMGGFNGSSIIFQEEYIHDFAYTEMVNSLRSNEIIFNTVEAFNIKTKLWETKTSMNHKRHFFGIAVYNDQIYVAGGLDISTVERYDPPTNSWTTLANIRSSFQVGLCTLGNKLICAGGSENTVEQYDHEENKWISLPSNNKAHLGYLLELPESAKLENW